MPGNLDTGTIVSGIGHIGLIGWVMIGGWLDWSTPEPVVTNVSMISGEEYAALVANAPTPDGVLNPGEQTPDVPEQAETPEPSAPETPPEQPAPPDPVEQAQPETPPEPDTPAAPEPEVAQETPPPPPTPATDEPRGAALVLDTSKRPKERPANRVAPTPVAPPEPDATVDTEATEAAEAVPAEEQVTEAEEQEQAAPEAAASEIVTEAEEEETGGEVLAALAPTGSPRPPKRPARRTTSEEVTDAAAEAAAQSASDSSSSGTSSSESASRPTPSRGGPPMTAGEKDALRVSVQQCWNVGSLSSDALRVTVTVAVSMNENGKPDNASIRMVGSEGGADGAVKQAFEAARRAIIRCGARGFPLPAEKYGEWAEIEMVFNPEKMRIK